MSDAEIFGIYLNSEFVTSVIALILTFALHRIVVLFGLNRRVWHQALFETALFVIIWGVVLNFSTSSIS
ncbi:DUF1656 domain-containing protein [Sideroxydans sp. CL21]|uniref:DUF1656 domain-containing protein n=1 Tax=Sideroxydans sp. CL21 TaxID=2600596 RepID=UPI0024BCA1D1|nr:DUF1656 domain-containing protein [Sideroxydans sp. CL21]